MEQKEMWVYPVREEDIRRTQNAFRYLPAETLIKA